MSSYSTVASASRRPPSPSVLCSDRLSNRARPFFRQSVRGPLSLSPYKVSGLVGLPHTLESSVGAEVVACFDVVAQ